MNISKEFMQEGICIAWNNGTLHEFGEMIGLESNDGDFFMDNNELADDFNFLIQLAEYSNQIEAALDELRRVAPNFYNRLALPEQIA